MGIGWLIVHDPAAAPPLLNADAISRPPDATNSHSESEASRGNASRVAPIWSGTMAVASPTHTGTRKRKKANVPWRVSSCW